MYFHGQVCQAKRKWALSSGRIGTATDFSAGFVAERDHAARDALRVTPGSVPGGARASGLSPNEG